MSVCLSVHLSVTLRYCIKTKTVSFIISSPSESLNILVSGNMWIVTKIERAMAISETGVGKKLAILTIFRPINNRISETVQDRAKVTIDH